MYTDSLGREILVGNVLTYPVRTGSSLIIYPAIVRGFDDKGVAVETFEVRYHYDWDSPDGGSSYVVHRRQTHLIVTERATITSLTEDDFIHHMEADARQQTEMLRSRRATVGNHT